RLIKGVGGLYFVSVDQKEDDPLSGRLVPCRARGKFRHAGTSPLVGDRVEITYNARTLAALDTADDGASEIMISKILDRKNALIRPPLANLDVLFIAMASASPAPLLPTVDKLILIAEFNEIEPIIVIGKQELDPDNAERIAEIYRKAGFEVFLLSALTGDGVDAVRDYIKEHLAGKIAAFAGASGVGKSSLMNRLFPHIHMETGEISQKIERGKNTTRHVELFTLPCEGGEGYLADTPGFSMLDFVHFDFFSKDDLPYTLREFRDYIGCCRYKKCTHTKEDGCAIREAVANGDIAPSRYQSFLEIYDVLKDKKEWQQK
ncbi:MAG: ribosome small subunit-dependent GTPase A, partial [Clostridia bacterium]|nr:ribosome small subunit-dependent GTPase A [Clostridia bacterium]